MEFFEANSDDLEKLSRKSIKKDDGSLFNVGPNWKSHWWGMPAFNNENIKPYSQITVSFLTAEDRRAFYKKLGLSGGSKQKSIWFPQQTGPDPGEYKYLGPKTNSRYPVCIPSKGRAALQVTGKTLDGLGVDYKFFVEETEEDQYKEALGEDRVVVMPFHDLGKGSIPARNFIWNWAKEREHKRHWVVDDNIYHFYRANLTRRIQVGGGGFFNAMEDFVDRYENIAMAGPHHSGFVKVGWTAHSPVLFNTRVYSCILLDTNVPYQWRGRYNEDTDLSLRLLKDGYCTAVFCSLMMQKGATFGSKGKKAMSGGNTDNVYNTGDNRWSFANSLKEQHPDVVDVIWKFGRWHHQVDYSPFKNNTPIFKEGVVPSSTDNEYGMRLYRRKTNSEEKS
jgi:hypothetical protein